MEISPMARGTKNVSHHPSGKDHMTSERHDVLYSKARYVLNQRHIKRPWFNLNPFLEKTDETVDLDNFLPEESKYIQRLESLVLCESYSSDLPIDTREIALEHGSNVSSEKFFEYLNSDLWKDGCSIRVLEGQLLDQLLLCLYRLERENKAVRHTTYAFARNKRKRTGCYKLADKEAYAVRNETLLIEFAYFGTLTKDQPNEKFQNPMQYLREDVADFTLDDVGPAEQAGLEAVKEEPSSTQVKRRSRAASIQLDAFRSLNFTDMTKPDDAKRSRRESPMTKHVNAIRFVNVLNTQIRRQSIATVQDITTSSGTPMASLKVFTAPQERRRESVTFCQDDIKGRRRRSSIATADSQLSTVRFRKTSMPVSHELNSDSEAGSPLVSELDDVDTIKSACLSEDKCFYGDEFYLADDKVDFTRNQEPVQEKLKRKKQELIKKRELLRQELEEAAKAKKSSILPPISPINADKIHDNATMHHTIKLPDQLPTFEEFVKLLKEDEYYDPRYRNKVRLKSKIIAQRYYIAKGMHRSSVMFNLDNIPDDIKYVGLTRRYMQQRASVVNANQAFNKERRGSNGAGSKGKLRLPALQESGPKSQRKTDGLSDVSIGSAQSRDHWRFAEEVHGVTDSEPCRDHCLKGKGSFHKQREEKLEKLRVHVIGQGKSSTKSQTELALSGQDVTLTTVSEEGVSTASQHLSDQGVNVASSGQGTGQTSPMFPKIELCDEERESPDRGTDESDVDDETLSLFDASKLNVKYSIERLRKKRRMKRRRPAFLDVLSKYYKMHAALKAFRKTSASREEKNARERVKRIARSQKAASKQGTEQEFVIGKLRRFPFNDVKSKKRLNLDNLSRGEFSKPDLSTFHENVQKATDEYVVRREIVVSDTQTFYRAATSVTFTKKSCFKKKHIDI